MKHNIFIKGLLFFAVLFSLSGNCFGIEYKYKDTLDLISTVQNAASLIQYKGKSAFLDFKSYGNQFLHGETYVFVMDMEGNILCHPDKKFEGTNQKNLADVNGRQFIKQMLKESLDSRKGYKGWVHYLWPRPGKIFPVWKSSYVMSVFGPYGTRYIVASCLYEMKPEKAMIEDEIQDAVFLIEGRGESALDSFNDPNNSILFGNIYLFIDSLDGTELVNPAFPDLAGKNIFDLKDSNGKSVVKDYINLALTNGSGWIDYMWPKPMEDRPSKKSTFVSKAKFKDTFLVVGSGLYFDDDAPLAKDETSNMTSLQLVSFVKDAADLIKAKGESAFPDLRREGNAFYKGDKYIFVWGYDGLRKVYPPDVSIEGVVITNLKDPRGRNIGAMCFDAVKNPQGEGWAHYEWNKPGAPYSSWKSNYLVKVKAPSGNEYLVGSGVFNMKPDETIIVDRVNKAADLLEKEGRLGFNKLRDKLSEFIFMDNYIFVEDMKGTEIVNAGFPNLEGQNFMDSQDSNGKKMVEEYISLADKNGSGWVDYMWPKPGTDTPSLKRTYVKKVKIGNEYFVVGCGAFW